MAAAYPGEPAGIDTVDAFPQVRLAKPLWFAEMPDGSRRGMALEQGGRIVVFPLDGSAGATTWLDLSTRINAKENEEGLLAAAFHPQFKDNGRFFVWTTRLSGRQRKNCLHEITVTAGKPDLASEREVLAIDDFAWNHNGGTLAFGSDGFLYISTGDGGGGGDPKRAGQDLSTLLGKVLRIDVDRREPGKGYGVPGDNPFVGKPAVRGEIWAYGLRNVWRMAFDPATGDLWAGDVGQNAREEIDVIVKGGNYGWNLREGTIPHQGGEAKPEFIEPVVDYPRNLGVSVTGGAVYRGTAQPLLHGVYLYADFGSGRVWGLARTDGKLAWNRQLGKVDAPSSFGQDLAGELYVCSYADGSIRRIVAK